MAPENTSTLTPAQLAALFDILNHNETYGEARSFKYDQIIQEYGYPFSAEETSQRKDQLHYTSSPLLKLLLTKCVLAVPGVGDLPPDFFPTHFRGIIQKLAGANLSESYDKGTLGTRKTLATGASVIHEAVTRGLLAGVPKGAGKIDLKRAQYDTMQAPELARAWNECVRELVHGDLADELFDHCAKTADFEGHSPAVAAATDYAILHIASLLHHVLVGSSEGQYLLKLIENVHKLVPFVMVRQTLRIGNAATMLNGMIRVFLAKVGVGAVTNWFGITSGAADGMNLLQRIISLVLYWDANEFRKQATKTESVKDHPSKEHFAALKAYTTLPRDTHEAMREISTTESKSIVAVIFDTTDPQLNASLSDAQHTQCLEWLSAQLSARDRDEIIKALCKSQPDHLTSAVRGAVNTHEPLIRSLHENLDLREHVTSVETFIGDLIETSKPKKTKGESKSKIGKTKTQESRPPSVEEYVALLRRNKGLLYEYAHQFAGKCAVLREMVQKWAHLTLAEFRQQKESTSAAGAISDQLQDLYSQLAVDEQKEVLSSLDAHASYLNELDALSQQRMQHVLDRLDKEATEDKTSCKNSKSSSSKSSSSSSSLRDAPGGSPSMSGPGVYLMRWESLLDDTLITPATASGPVRYGRDVKGRRSKGKTVSEGVKGGWDADAITKEENRAVPAAPDVDQVMALLGEGFKKVVNAEIGDARVSVSEKVELVMGRMG